MNFNLVQCSFKILGTKKRNHKKLQKFRHMSKLWEGKVIIIHNKNITKTKTTISQLLLNWFWLYFKVRFLGSTLMTKSTTATTILTVTTTKNKTWSSVSNSKFSKTFVLGSLESVKFRSFVLSLQRSFSLKFILGEKKFWVWKNFGSKKNFGHKNFGSEKFLGLKNFRFNKFFVLKIYWVPKKF